MSSTRHMLCALLVAAATAALGTAAFAANDGVPNAAPDTTQGTAPAAPQAGTNPQASPQTGTSGRATCRQAKPRPQLTPEQKAQRRAAWEARRAAGETGRPAQGAVNAGRPRLPLC